MRYVFWRALEKKVVGVVYIKILQNMYNGVVTKVKTREVKQKTFL